MKLFGVYVSFSVLSTRKNFLISKIILIKNMPTENNHFFDSKGVISLVKQVSLRLAINGEQATAASKLINLHIATMINFVAPIR